MNRCLRGSLPKICICREPPELSVHAFLNNKACAKGILEFKVADKVSDDADKIKGIKIWEAIKCRILPILIPVI